MSEILTDWGSDFEGQIRLRAWPDFARGGFYLDLMQIAEEILDSQFSAGTIGALFIYQQLAEEILRAIDYWCHYRQMLTDYPHHKPYESPNRMMFGQLIQRIVKSSDFYNKAEIVAACDKLNQSCRIPMAHRLLYDDNINRCGVLAEDAKSYTMCIIRHLRALQDAMFEDFDILAQQLGIPDERPSV